MRKPYTTGMKTVMNIARVVFWVSVCQLAGLTSIPFVQPNMAWFHTLARPPLAPPDAVFGPIWAVLYLLLGLSSAWLFCRGLSKELRPAAALLIVQLVLNACWTPVFFGMHNFQLALAVVALMLAEGFFMHRSYAKHSKIAALLLWPYWIWLGFATYLTAGFMMLN